MCCSVAWAVPYASSVSESGGDVSFVLNEDADAITVYRTGDTDLVLTGNDLLKGTVTFSKGSASAYSIEVSKSTAAGYTQISDDANPWNTYYRPNGVAINKNPASEYFGRIYVSEGTSPEDPNDWSTTRTQSTLAGLYTLGADRSDIEGLGDDGAYGGIDWTLSANSPFRISVAPDDSVYISDWSDTHGGVWRAPGDLNESSNWPNVLANDNRDPNSGGLCDNHGSITAVWVEGTGANTKLYTIDEDWPDASGTYASGRGDILRYDIGTTTNYTAGPDAVQVDDGGSDPNNPGGYILNGLMDFVRDDDGSWWISQWRSDDEKTIPVLSHWEDGSNEPIWTSGKNPRTAGDFDWDSDVDGADFMTWQRNANGSGTVWQGDADGNTVIDPNDVAIWEENFGESIPGEVVMQGGRHVDIQNDLDLVAIGAVYGYGVYIVDISDPNDPNLVATIPQSGTTIQDVAFDIAGNVYTVNRSAERLRVYSPGGDTVATTTSAGTFSLSSAAEAVAAAVPEPSSLLMVMIGLTCLAGGRRSARRL